MLRLSKLCLVFLAILSGCYDDIESGTPAPNRVEIETLLSSPAEHSGEYVVTQGLISSDPATESRIWIYSEEIGPTRNIALRFDRDPTGDEIDGCLDSKVAVFGEYIVVDNAPAIIVRHLVVASDLAAKSYGDCFFASSP